MPKPLPSRDRDQRAVRPSPTRVVNSLRSGAPVITKRGPGKVVDVILSVGGWEGGQTRLMPPIVNIELEEPWEGQTHVALPLPHVRLPKEGAVFKGPCQELWPDQVPSQPARTLRPTTEPKVRLSQLVKLWRNQ
jgi:hypothetical protein